MNSTTGKDLKDVLVEKFTQGFNNANKKKYGETLVNLKKNLPELFEKAGEKAFSIIEIYETSDIKEMNFLKDELGKIGLPISCEFESKTGMHKLRMALDGNETIKKLLEKAHLAD